MHLTCRLRQLREARGLSITQAERETGISKGTLSAIERGKALPLDKHVSEIERVYGARLVEVYSPAGLLALQEGDAAE